jgi:hypothetical protein
MIKELIKMAGELDRLGLTKEADKIDAMVRKASNEFDYGTGIKVHDESELGELDGDVYENNRIDEENAVDPDPPKQLSDLSQVEEYEDYLSFIQDNIGPIEMERIHRAWLAAWEKTDIYGRYRE